MPASGYIFVPNDGSFEKPLSAAEVKSFKHIDDHDAILQTRFSELLHQRNINVPFWLGDKGVMIYGTGQQARAVSHIVEGLPNLAPSKNSAHMSGADNDNRPHISGVFGDAAERYKIQRPSASFNMAAKDEPKLRSFTRSRPSIRGNYGTMTLANAA